MICISTCLSNKTLFYKFFVNKNRTVSQITKGYTHPTLLIICLEIFRTRVILLCTHPQVVYYNCVKFQQ